MHQSGTITWLVSCELPNELRKAEETARAESSLDKEIVTHWQSVRGGSLKTETHSAHVRDYFSSVEVLTELLPTQHTFSLEFHPVPDADSFWRTAMVRILTAIRDSAKGVKIKRIEHASN
jgi:hypothetical protein